MKNLFLYIVCFLLFLPTPACTSLVKAKIPIESFVKVHKEVKVLRCPEKAKVCYESTSGFIGSGSSVYLTNNKNTILTAGHLCHTEMNSIPKDIKKIEVSLSVIDHTNTSHKADIIIYSLDNMPAADLCMLEVKTLNIPKIKLSKEPPEPGDDVIALAAPSGIYHPPTVPIFKGVYSGVRDKVSSIATFPATFGSSGGPVLNKKGHLLGAIYAVHLSAPNITLITNYSSTKMFLQISKKVLLSSQTK